MDINEYIKIMDDMNVKQMILQGPPGTSKTFRAKQIVATKLNGSTEEITDKEDIRKILEKKEENKNRWKMVQFHPSYGYEDFVRGITVKTENNQICYQTINKAFGEICKKAEEDKQKDPYFLIIDEINRADVATVFGELIYALEYRGERISLPYSLDAGKGEEADSLCVPDNLYIIATMNTADKSVGNIDYAIRRRFVFFDCPPDKDILESFYENDKNDKTIENGDLKKKSVALFCGVNKFIGQSLKKNEYRVSDFQIGHTYFMARSEGELENKFQYQVLPILREYYIDSLFDHSKIEGTEKKLKSYLSGEPDKPDLVGIMNEFTKDTEP